MNISGLLIYWYVENKRDLPWRNTHDPYFIWLSEVILQQTRVNQGMSYYFKFIENFPTVFDLAGADEQTVLKTWQGLGYYSRARNLHYTAKKIAYTYEGKFPQSKKELENLKGVGAYTAAAIASFCFNEPVAVVDGNVSRVLARIFEVSTPVNSTKGHKIIEQMANELIKGVDSAQFNQAVMELGALVCVPKNPKCSLCPVVSYCGAYKNNNVKDFPVKNALKKPKSRYFTYLIIVNEDKILLRKREGKDIWKNMYDFPCIENDTEKENDEIIKQIMQYDVLADTAFEIMDISKTFLHQLTHQSLYARFYYLKTEGINGQLPKNVFWTKKNEINNYPLPRLIDKYLKNSFLNHQAENGLV